MSNTTIRNHCVALTNGVDYLLACIRDGDSDPVALQECADHMHAARDALAAEPVGEAKPVAYLKEWCHSDGSRLESLRRVDLSAQCERWLENYHPTITPLFAHPSTPPAPEVGDRKRLRIMAAGIRYGYMAGHEDTVEACYGDPDEVAADHAPEILGELGIAPEPEKQADSESINAISERTRRKYDRSGAPVPRNFTMNEERGFL